MNTTLIYIAIAAMKLSYPQTFADGKDSKDFKEIETPAFISNEINNRVPLPEPFLNIPNVSE